MPPRPTESRFDSPSAMPYYVGFIVAGMATVLLGAILPVLSARWALTDLQAGSLFAAQFTASAFGAILASHFRHRSLVFGYAAVAVGLAALALGNYTVVLIAFALLGMGLGSATTATNLTFGTQHPGERGALLARVNLFWGIGAVSCPPFVAVAVRPEMLRILLLALSLAALAVFATFALLLRLRNRSHQDELRDTGREPGLMIFLLFSVLLFLYVGGETSISGWIATYAHRFGNLSPAHSSLFVSAFWLCIVVGRGVIPLLVRFIPEFKMLISGVVAALLGISIPAFPAICRNQSGCCRARRTRLCTDLSSHRRALARTYRRLPARRMDLRHLRLRRCRASLDDRPVIRAHWLFAEGICCTPGRDGWRLAAHPG